MNYSISLNDFKKIDDKKGLFPLVLSISLDTETPVSLYKKIAEKKSFSFLLESAEKQESNGRYSIIGLEPIKKIFFVDGVCNINNKKESFKDPLEILKRELEELNSKYAKSFFGGLFGYFAFESIKYFEAIKFKKTKNKVPDGIFIIPRIILRFDHFSSEIKIVSFMDLEKDRKEEFEKAGKTLENIIKKLESQREIKPIELRKDELIEKRENPDFEKIVEEAKKKIVDGEIFQVVLSQVFSKKNREKPFEIYRKLRLKNPSPYLFFFDFSDFQIAGSSPETLIRLENDEILLRPIAGTRKRGKDKNHDKDLEKELLSDKKELAEHSMLLDLGRNDVGKVAKKGSVKVDKSFYVKKYSHVQHILSDVIGTIRKDKDAFDVFRAGFPAGTLTGAPKIRAMEIIAQLEERSRGIYGGAVGYFDFSGNMDFAILIRTIIFRGQISEIIAGAGIVYDSVPKNENMECIKKASAALSILK